MEHKVGAPLVLDRDCEKGQRIFPCGKRADGQLCQSMCVIERYHIINCRASGVRVDSVGLDDLPDGY